MWFWCCLFLIQGFKLFMTPVNFIESENDLFLESSAICKCWRYLKRSDLKYRAKYIHMTHEFKVNVTSMIAESCQCFHWSPQWPQNLSGWRRSWGRGDTQGPRHDASESTGQLDSSPGGIPSPDPFLGLTPNCCNSILSLCPIWLFPCSFQSFYNQVSTSTFPRKDYD